MEARVAPAAPGVSCPAAVQARPAPRNERRSFTKHAILLVLLRALGSLHNRARVRASSPSSESADWTKRRLT